MSRQIVEVRRLKVQNQIQILGSTNNVRLRKHSDEVLYIREQRVY